MRALISGSIVLLLALVARAANFVPNSSFEVGSGRGWHIIGDDTLGLQYHVNDLLTNNAPAVSNFCMRSEALLTSRGFFLTNGTYSLSYYARYEAAPGSSAGPLYAGVISEHEIVFAVSPFSGGGTWTSGGIYSSSWSRFSVSFTVSGVGSSPNFLKRHYVRFSWFQAGFYQVDGVQIEPGTTVNDYQPSSTVEVGLSIPNQYFIWYENSASPTFKIHAYNFGATSNQTINYKVWDVQNSNVLSGAVTASLAKGSNYTTTVSLAGLRGWYRVMAWPSNYFDAGDELCTVVYPFASNQTANAEAWLGGHTHSSSWQVRRHMLVGRKYLRTLSESGAAQRWNLVEPTQDNFVWTDYIFDNLNAGGAIIVSPLSERDGFWRTNAGVAATFADYSNYVHTLVERYDSLYPTNHYEIWNEPLQSGPTAAPYNLRDYATYTTLLKAGITGITNADPNAKIIAMAGASGNGEWADLVWSGLTAAEKDHVDAVSTHIYPQDDDDDPNEPFDANGLVNQAAGWAFRFLPTGKEIWNTESGSYLRGFGQFRGWNGYHTILDGGVQFTYLENRRWSWTRVQQTMLATACEAIRDIGLGFRRYIYYDGRLITLGVFDAGGYGPVPYPADYLAVDKPATVALSVATAFIHRGFGRLTNATPGYWMEMYNYTNAIGQKTIAIWNTDRLTRTLTTTNAQIGVFDVMGNLQQTNSTTIRIDRFPRYLLSGTLTLEQLSNTVKFASVATVADTVPPQVAFGIFPNGALPNTNDSIFMTWLGLDNRYTAWNTAATGTNIVYRYQLDDDGWSTWNSSNQVVLSPVMQGSHFFYVQARDRDGNLSDIVSTPHFWAGATSAPDPPVEPPLEVPVTAGRRGRSKPVSFFSP